MTAGRDLIREVAAEFVEERLFCTSVQVSVIGPSFAGTYSHGHIFEGCPTTDEHLFSVHCATKPLVALAVGLLVDTSDIDLDSSVCQLVPDSLVSGELVASVRSVLNHSARLAHPSMLLVNLTPLESRGVLVREGIATSRPGYSEFSGQYVLAEIISKISGVPAIDFIESSITRPLGLASQVRLRFARPELEAEACRIGCYVTGLPICPTPVVHDWSPHLACIDRTCLGGYVSASGLGGLYQAIGRVYRGEVVAGLPSPTTLCDMLHVRSPARYDEVLHRSCSFAGGFMVDLADHGYGPSMGDDSFGHTGLSGASFAFYDPHSEVGGAVISNGLHQNHDDLDFFRSRMVRAMVQAAGRENGLDCDLVSE